MTTEEFGPIFAVLFVTYWLTEHLRSRITSWRISRDSQREDFK